MVIPALEKARSDVALDDCTHSRCLAKSAISGWLGPYLSYHFNTVQLLKSTTNSVCVCVIGPLFNHLFVVTLTPLLMNTHVVTSWALALHHAAS